MDSLAANEGGSKVIHTGTHNAHPVAAAAGIAMLDEIADGIAQEKAEETCKKLIDGFNGILEVAGIPGLAYGASSHFCILLGVPPERAGDPTSYGSERLRAGTEPAIFDSMNCGMMLQGVHLFHGHGFVSSAHDNGDVETTLAAFQEVIARMKSEGILT
jgi:glutamate-1-semialdehyde 2,1-aminomutase